METTTPGKRTLATVWIGRVLTGLSILFLLVDSTMKIIKESHSVEGTLNLGWPDTAVQPIGILLLVCTILYIIPRTAILGDIFLTAYLGGAVATMARIDISYWFPIMFGVLVWGGLFLRDEKLRALIPLKK